MKTKSMLLGALVSLFGFSKATAQTNLGASALSAVSTGLSALTFSDADAVQLADAAVVKLDSANTVAASTDPYMIRLNRVFAPHKNENGIVLTYKVYKTKDVNAFAMANGNVRVFSGLMDIMDDNQLLAVIGHEIGHVAHHDSKNAAKEAYVKQALTGAATSVSAKIQKMSQSQVATVAGALYDARYTRAQESNADTYSYDFMKSHGYDVNAVESAFNVLVQTSQGANSNIMDMMMSSHPDPATRAATAKKRAEADGLYKPYVQKAIVNTIPVAKPAAKAPAKKAPAKKAPAKKK